VSRHGSPHLGALALVFTVLKLASLYPVSALAGAAFPAPAVLAAYFPAHTGPVLACAFLQFASAIPLGIFVATAVSRMRFLGVRAAGIDIALFGGLLATFDSIASAAVLSALANPAAAHAPTLVPALYAMQFTFGGPGYAVPLGLFLAGLSVPALFLRLLPKWVVWLGLALAAVGELGWLALAVPGALFLIPLLRFPAFVWLIAAGFALPVGAVRRVAPAGPGAQAG
jgi:hypothetical protein